jgi:predicted type IV restriction endonuclease
MANIPAKVETRLIAGIKKFQSILNAAKTKDINESDTVVIVTDLLSEIFGYDKYSEITSEYSIKKTFCDLAIKIENKIRFLIEVKAIGISLKEDQLRQAVDYGANAGVDWIILTNGNNWKIFKVIFGKPIQNELVYEFDILTINSKKQDDLELLYYVCKETLGKSMLEEFHIQKQSLNKFFIGQIVLTEPVLDAIRKTIKKISPEIKVDNHDIMGVMPDILKREVLEGEKVDEAKKKITRAFNSLAKKEEQAKTAS